uniref:Uncharacterized protein n=1 Tax=Romanomermis culicivorax TaxID=13658 RepID=A0A915J9X8_ROMCU
MADLFWTCFSPEAKTFYKDIAKACNHAHLEVGLPMGHNNINLAIESMLQNTAAKYPIRRSHVIMLYITASPRSAPLNSLFTRPLPHRLVVALVDGAAARRDYYQSPFNLKHFGLNEIKITSNTTTLPTTPYMLDFKEKKYLHTFIQLFEGIGIGTDNKSNTKAIVLTCDPNKALKYNKFARNNELKQFDSR